MTRLLVAVAVLAFLQTVDANPVQKAIEMLQGLKDKLVEEEAMCIRTFQAWKAWATLQRKIEESLDAQAVVDNRNTVQRAFGLWRQVHDLRKTTTRSDRLLRYSVCPIQDLNEAFQANRLHEVSAVAAHRRAVGAKLLIDVRTTMTLRVSLVAWRVVTHFAINEMHESAMAPSRVMKGQYSSKLGDERPLSAGMSPALYQQYVLKTWAPRMLRQRFFKTWVHFHQTSAKKLMKKRMSARFLSQLMEKYQRTHNRLFLKKYLDLWVQKMWICHADALLEQERQRMRRAHSLRASREQERHEAQQAAVRRKLCPVCSAKKEGQKRQLETGQETSGPKQEKQQAAVEAARQDAAKSTAHAGTSAQAVTAKAEKAQAEAAKTEAKTQAKAEVEVAKAEPDASPAKRSSRSTEGEAADK